MRRRIAIVLLSLGVFFGYGSAVARASYYSRHGGEGCRGWQSRYDNRWDRDRGERFEAPAAAPAPAPAVAAPQTVVVQPPAAPAPVYIIIPSGAAPSAPQTVVPQTIVLQPQALPASPVRAEPVEARPTPGNPKE